MVCRNEGWRQGYSVRLVQTNPGLSLFIIFSNYSLCFSLQKSQVNMSSNRESVTFGINGQPISDNAPQLSSFIGWIVKSIVAPTYDTWKSVPRNLKEEIWKLVTTDMERKQKLPQYDKKEDWDRFVDIQLMPDYQAKRHYGKRAKKEMKSPHTSGRKGQARVAEDMDKIKKTIMDDTSSAYNDLENDAVEQVHGPDT